MNLVLFDVDGTLLDNVRGDDAAYLRAFRREFGVESIDTDWTTFPHCTDSCITREVLRARFGREATDDEIRRAREAYVAELRVEFASGAKTAEPMRGVESAVEQMTSLGWRGAVATGGWRASATLKLAQAGLAAATWPGGFADDHLTREGIAETARRRAEELHGRAARRVVFVGDGVWDAKCCEALALPFVGIAVGARAEKLRAAGATIVLPDFAEGFLDAIDAATPPRAGA